MLNFKKLFLGFLFSVLFSAVLIAVCAFMILKLGFLPSGPILGTLYAVFYVAISVMLYTNMRVVLLVIRSVIFVICSVCGGVMGVNRDEKIRF